ncbi:carbohydrate kinase family protein [Exiguobacterium alkaliphilum]|uniref:Carbohydrate kinase n=1 Tax=Exiguobacterium alkaliphilum TaxID=1428684 RepID=A0ABT2KYE6_9BACL|nr:carbohydrate kinase [Exiguobacterium alkaliphilum]MCT4794580.1 carbohydrate kinase [Exiguobacterium alkaliphilum]
MSTVHCIGELLIDWVCEDASSDLVNGTTFVKKAGGAPANVAAVVSKHGGASSFLGQVGADPFGQFLKETLQTNGVGTDNLVEAGDTTFAFVSIQADGERDFTFRRGSDGDYAFDAIDLSQFKSGDIVHFGSATALLDGELKNAYFKLLQFAKRDGLFVSFDPNYRDALVTDLEAFKQDSLHFIAEADFVKLSEEEAHLLTGAETLDEAVDALLKLGASRVAITLGSRGTLIATSQSRDIIPSVKIESVDSTGAGDAFVGAYLYRLATLGVDDMRLQKDIEYANVTGALTCTAYGAIPAIPSPQRVQQLLGGKPE